MTNKRFFYPVLAILVAGVIIGSFFDYQISNALYLPGNFFGKMMASVGELPAYSLLGFGGGYLFYISWNNLRKSFNGWVVILGSLFAFGCGIYFLGHAITNVNGFNIPDKKWIVGMPIAAVIITPLFILGLFTGKRVKDINLWKLMFWILLMMGVTILIITLVKLIPHRPRFRVVIDPSNPIEYCNWWNPCNNYKDFLSDTITREEFKSFPSGHIGITSGIVYLMYMPALLEKPNTPKIRAIIFYSAFAYILLLAYTRIMSGAHYLSDVCMGGLISLAFHFPISMLMDRIYNKDHEKKLEQ